MDKVLIIDGLNFIYKAKIKFGIKKESEKPDYTIVYNFFRNLRALIEQFQPNRCFFVLEGKDNFRYTLYENYKANRIKTGSEIKQDDKDFERQKYTIIGLLKNLPITIVRSDGFESDDTVATLAHNLKDEHVVIVSNDTDYIQLLQNNYSNIEVYNPFSKKNLEAPEYNYLLWKILSGDVSDNIPSIIGKAKAEKLCKNLKAVEELLSSSEEIRSNFSLNKELIELKIISDDKLNFEDYDVNFDFLKEQFAWMDLPSLVDENYWNKFIETFSILG